MTIVLDAEQLQVQELHDFEWPITFRWHMQTPFGRTQQDFTVDAPGLRDDIEGSMALGHVLWQRSIAPAMVTDVELTHHDTVMWRFVAAGLPQLNTANRGMLAGTAAPRDDSACIVMHTGHMDHRAVRRLIIPGIPSAWASDGLIGVGARHALESLGQGLIMGLARHLTGSPMLWLLAYPQLLEPQSDNPSGVGFRKVEYLRIAWHTDKAPLPSSEPWP